MSDLRRVSVLGCLLLVLLRLSIGWQFLYEGLWKFDSLNTANPWTSAGYLKNAQGPFRSLFRNLGGDPNEFNWLDVDKVSAKWDVWQKQFAEHYQLDENDRRRLDEMLNGSPEFRAELSRLPEGVEFRGSLGEVVKYDADAKRLIVSGERHLLPDERDRLLAMVPLSELTTGSEEDRKLAEEYHKAVNRLFTLSSRLSFKERLRASLVGDPERAGVINEEHKGTVDYKRMGDIELYRILLEKYEKDLANAQGDFQHDHLGWTQRNKLQDMHRELVGPIKALDDELQVNALNLLSTDQLALGPVPQPLTRQQLLDRMTMWSLTIIGVMLIAGLFTRLASVAGAGLLMMFYLAVPPWPGVPEAPGPEHSFIVNKNFIEAMALLAFAALPSGRWFGLDALLRRFLWKSPTD